MCLHFSGKYPSLSSKRSMSPLSSACCFSCFNCFPSINWFYPQNNPHEEDTIIISILQIGKQAKRVVFAQVTKLVNGRQLSSPPFGYKGGVWGTGVVGTSSTLVLSLSVDDVQVSCYRTLCSIYSLGTTRNSYVEK